MRNRFITIVFFAYGAFIVSCKQQPKETPETKTTFCLSDTMKNMITIDTVTMSRMEDEVRLSGQVSFDENKVIKIFARSSGQVISCNVSPGDKVTAGQVLATIKSADVAGSYEDIASADADIVIAKKQMDNAGSLFKSGIGSEKDYLEAQQNYQKTLSAKRKIESQLNINGGGSARPGGTYTITSPISGYIVEKKINTGNFIRSDESDNIFTISDLKDVWVMANVFETDIPRVKEGMPVTVTTLAYPDKPFTGTIEKASEILDPDSKTMHVRIRLNNPDLLLKPEMFARVTVTNEQNIMSVCLPFKAIVEEDGRYYVIVYKNDCDLHKQEVTVTKTVGDKTYIADGVKPGDRVITKNALLLYNQFSE
ncbi:MAG TPA: efflux RND transporter periplasmic adaptor subunit [Chitinophagaceae bacterium]|nr:efflux RND transporter periplasmic adaptor subunit [Chitinophagaceae bacterium]